MRCSAVFLSVSVMGIFLSALAIAAPTTSCSIALKNADWYNGNNNCAKESYEKDLATAIEVCKGDGNHLRRGDAFYLRGLLYASLSKWKPATTDFNNSATEYLASPVSEWMNAGDSADQKERQRHLWIGIAEDMAKNHTGGSSLRPACK